MTGRQPARVGMPNVLNSLSVGGLPLNETLLPQYLSVRGYRSAMVGKWHLGQRPCHLPAARGFDQFLGLPFSVDDGRGYVVPCSRGEHTLTAPSDPSGGVQEADAGPGDLLGPLLPLPLLRQEANGSSAIVNQPTNLMRLSGEFAPFLVDFIETHREEPFVIYAAFPHVHTATPDIGPDKQYAGCAYQNTTRRGRFGDALAELDGLAGEVRWGLGGCVLSLEHNIARALRDHPHLWGRAAAVSAVRPATQAHARQPLFSLAPDHRRHPRRGP